MLCSGTEARGRQIPYDSTYTWNLKDRKQTNKASRRKDTETKGAAARRERVEGLCEEGEGPEKYNWQSQKRYRNTANNIVVTAYGAGWALDVPWRSAHELCKCLAVHL